MRAAAIAASCVALAGCSASTPSVRPAASAPASSANAAQYLVVAEQQRTSLRVLPLRGSGFDVPAGTRTMNASSRNGTAVITAPAVGKLLLVSGWPPRVRVVGGLSTPHDAAFSADGLVAATEEGRDDVAVVDPRTLAVVRRVPLPGRPHDLAPDDRGRLAVTLPDSRMVAWVDPEGGTFVPVRLAERPHDCLPAGTRLWCVTYDAPHLLLVEGGRVARRITLGVFPHHLAPGDGGTLLVSDPTGGRVYRLDGEGGVIATYAVPRPAHLLEHEGSVYVASEDGYVAVFGRAGGRVDVPGDPHGIALVA